jgi:hypothetical protein
MQGRPSSSRPSTSARPTTAFDRDQFQHHQQRLQQQQPLVLAEEEYDEESDDEDVFAFFPPTTADQEQQSTSQSPFTFAAVPYPEPTFDPWDRQYPSPPAALIPPSIHGIQSETHSYPHTYNQPPLSPSTDSHPSTGMSGPDIYRLKSLGIAASPKLAVVEEGEKKGVDSQSNSQSQSQTYHQQHHARTGVLGMPKLAGSLTDSLSITQSMLEDDESRSIK